MKLKATVSDATVDCSLEERFALANFVIASNTPGFSREIYDKILVPFMRVPPMGDKNAWHAGDFFVQETDRSSPWDPGVIGIDVTLSGVSATALRAVADLWTSVDALAEVYQTLVESVLLRGMKVHLMCRAAVDRPVPFMYIPGQTTLLEHDTIWIEGSKEPSSSVTVPMVLEAELKARLGEVTGEGFFRLACQRGPFIPVYR